MKDIEFILEEKSKTPIFKRCVKKWKVSYSIFESNNIRMKYPLKKYALKNNDIFHRNNK